MSVCSFRHKNINISIATFMLTKLSFLFYVGYRLKWTFFIILLFLYVVAYISKKSNNITSRNTDSSHICHLSLHFIKFDYFYIDVLLKIHQLKNICLTLLKLNRFSIWLSLEKQISPNFTLTFLLIFV